MSDKDCDKVEAEMLNKETPQAEKPSSEDSSQTASKDAPPTPSPTKKDSDTTSKAFMHLAAGKRHLAVEDYKNAVADLEEACRLLGEVFGEAGPECADAYYYYGSALLDLARQEHGVFGMPESEEASAADDDSEDQKDEDQIKACKKCVPVMLSNESELEIASSKQAVTAETSAQSVSVAQAVECILCVVEAMVDEEDKSGENDAEKERGEESKVEENGEVDENNEKVAEKEDTEKEEDKDGDEETEEGMEVEETTEEAPAEQEQEEEEEEPDDVSSLQLAWEVLEVAKVAFIRRESEGIETQKKLALVYLKLGEVSLESENYTQSVSDLKSCLEIRQKLLPPYHRDVAEVHYQLATALQFDKEYDLAISHYSGAVKVLEDKIKYLNEVIQRRAAKEKGENVTGDDGSAEREKDAFYTEEDEIEEIKKLLPDIQEKITDTKDLKAEYFKKLAQVSDRLKSGEGSSSSSGTAAIFQEVILKSNEPSAVSAASPTKPTSNISHLVKKKRKPEETVENEAEKKVKVLNGVESKESIPVLKKI